MKWPRGDYFAQFSPPWASCLLPLRVFADSLLVADVLVLLTSFALGAEWMSRAPQEIVSSPDAAAVWALLCLASACLGGFLAVRLVRILMSVAPNPLVALLLLVGPQPRELMFWESVAAGSRRVQTTYLGAAIVVELALLVIVFSVESRLLTDGLWYFGIPVLYLIAIWIYRRSTDQRIEQEEIEREFKEAHERA